MSEKQSVAEFYAGKNLFITGVTGCLGKVILEKLLRSCPDLINVYILLRTKRGKSVEERFNVLLESQAFSRLTKDDLEKIIPIAGDVLEKGLGISTEDRQRLVDNVDIVIHSAATVKFNEPLKFAIEMNVLPLRKVIELSREVKKLKCLCYVSTAFSQCTLQSWQPIEERIYKPSLDYESFIKDALVLPEEDLYTYAKDNVGKYPNSYTLSKAIAEYLLNQEASDLPITILRPSIIAPSLSEPMLGWSDTFHAISGNAVAIGTGMMRIVYAKRCHHDIVPVDYVSNYILASIWYTVVHRPSLPIVYNCTSSSINPTSIPKLVKGLAAAFQKYPLSKSFRTPSCQTTNNKAVYRSKQLTQHLLPAAVVDGVSPVTGRKYHLLQHYKKIHKVTKMIKFLTTHEWNWKADHQALVSEAMNEKDRKVFNFDMKTIDWNNFFEIIAIGTDKYLLAEKKIEKKDKEEIKVEESELSDDDDALSDSSDEETQHDVNNGRKDIRFDRSPVPHRKELVIHYVNH